MNKLFYAMYDLANSAYSIIIITFITSAYFAKQIVGDPQIGAAYWQWTAGACGIAVALSGPYLGAMADKKPKGKVNYLEKFTFLCIIQLVCSGLQNQIQIIFYILYLFFLFQIISMKLHQFFIILY